MKKFFVTIVLASMMSALVACGNETAKSTNSSEAIGKQETVEPMMEEPETEEKTEEKTEEEDLHYQFKARDDSSRMKPDYVIPEGVKKASGFAGDNFVGISYKFQKNEIVNTDLIYYEGQTADGWVQEKLDAGCTGPEKMTFAGEEREVYSEEVDYMFKYHYVMEAEGGVYEVCVRHATKYEGITMEMMDNCLTALMENVILMH